MQFSSALQRINKFGLGLMVTVCFIVSGCGGGSSSSSTSPATNTSGNWSAAGSLITGRADYTATLLANGKVLVTGGIGATNVLTSSELYDPATATWSATGNLNVARFGHTATLLPNGKVLVTGGMNSFVAPYNPISTVELYDPATGNWVVKTSMTTVRSGHTATLLPNGKVLVAGGAGASTELYDSTADMWAVGGSMNNARSWHSATLLSNGKVLVAGSGGGSNSAELYDPNTGLWSITGNLTVGRSVIAATLLPSGKVLVAGGWTGFSATGMTYTASAELYDPVTGTWAATGSLITGRAGFTPVLLNNGKVLVAGGITSSTSVPSGSMTASAELYDPATGTWSATGSLATARTNHTTTLLNSGKVLVAGGGPVGNGSAGTPLAGPVTTSSELY